VGRATSLLTNWRAIALAALVAGVVAWPAVADHLPALSLWADVALVVAVLIPATLAIAWLAVPYAGSRGLVVLALALAGTAVVCDDAGLDGLFNAAKLLTYVLAGYLFLRLLDDVLWVALVALVIPWVDALSVWRGPTNVVVEKRPDVFERIAVSFEAPGDGSAANLGPPDVVFFSLFLASAARDGLRVTATYLTTVALLGLTLVLVVALELDGLPALPAVAFGFLLPNADLLWARARAARAAR
jgi:hypothetical protein